MSGLYHNMERIHRKIRYNLIKHEFSLVRSWWKVTAAKQVAGFTNNSKLDQKKLET